MSFLSDFGFAVGEADDDSAGEVEKEAGVDDAGDAPESLVELFGDGRRRAELDVEEQVAVFGDE